MRASRQNASSETERFTFPTNIRTGTTFDNVEQILEVLDQEIRTTNIGANLFIITKFLNPLSGFFLLRCRHCSSYLQFQLKSELLVATHIHNEHHHEVTSKDGPLGLLACSPVNFAFPALIVGATFASRGELEFEIEKQAAERCLPPNLYEYRVRRRRGEWLQLSCKVCRAKLKLLLKQESQYQIVAIDAQHKHIQSPQKRPKQHETPSQEEESAEIGQEEEKAREKKKQVKPKEKQTKAAKKAEKPNKSENRTPALKSPPLKKKEEKPSPRKTEIPLEPEPTIREIKQSSAIEVQKDPSHQVKEEGVSIIVTYSMKGAYARYPQVLSFCVVPVRVRSPTSSISQMGVFAVQNVEGQAAIVGVALAKSFDTETIARALQMYLETASRPPLALLTLNLPEMDIAVEKLRILKVFSGAHLYDSAAIVKIFCQALNASSKDDSPRCVNLLREAIKTRQLKTLDERLRELTSTPSCRGLLERLLEKRSSIFYCNLPNMFSGLQRTACSEMIERWARVSSSGSINIIEELTAKAEQIYHDSFAESNRSNLLSETVEMELADGRLKDVRLRCSERVMSRFIENYIAALINYRMTARQVYEGRIIIIVESRVAAEKHVVRDWLCKCKEAEKTGVACAHVIAAAASEIGKAYTDLIAQRWKKP